MQVRHFKTEQYMRQLKNNLHTLLRKNPNEDRGWKNTSFYISRKQVQSDVQLNKSVNLHLLQCQWTGFTLVFLLLLL